MKKILEIKDISKKYNDFALDNVSFNLDRGYVMGFIGPNGAGKSTTIKLIMNLIRKDSGYIKVFGLDSVKDEKEIKERIGFVYDNSYFYEELTCESMKKIIAPFYKKWDEKLYKKYMDEFSLPRDKKIKELSKGMRMKYSIILALSHNAELIIMDEPTSGLDPVVRAEILDIFRDIIQDENKSLIFSSHITMDLEKIADYITFINNGKIVFSEEKDSIIESYGIVKGDNDLLDRDIEKEFIGVKKNKFGFEALTSNKEKTKKIFGNKVIIERPTIDDIMVYNVRGN
ncbi:ABC transporter family protein [Clostridium argentinense CDC 2741]|uniref:ABC transporter family protein n=1 Tax=Clostridium argentinense CDC 2741 TaxID=1418104 RepID=A0A0C1UFR6_9CLOT|nr:ABC transporter ATP-binding protein [Clostridium argentinense]ARC85861.1 sodium ABC transporter ATP-binding protein [Clostridium argentinense]KIE46255.1 ABC transporter family protein [Clostridium argentinense CDC 2741]NFF39947.1 ABC transporter ATP-binding protein [Clostridium argentinense]NFP48578.1 ABC transporter ATP-binding protein [Clostridium argentinense]NFP71154.1 ABC transporter ATP-binding protein [Clostridium argentinense]